MNYKKFYITTNILLFFVIFCMHIFLKIKYNLLFSNNFSCTHQNSLHHTLFSRSNLYLLCSTLLSEYFWNVIAFFCRIIILHSSRRNIKKMLISWIFTIDFDDLLASCITEILTVTDFWVTKVLLPIPTHNCYQFLTRVIFCIRLSNLMQFFCLIWKYNFFLLSLNILKNDKISFAVSTNNIADTEKLCISHKKQFSMWYYLDNAVEKHWEVVVWE